MKKQLLALSMLLTLSHATHAFKHYDDICERTQEQECINEETQVKNLQLALNKTLGLSLRLDGKWGENTKNAVIAFQEKYHITPVEGYVGRKTTSKLDEVTKGIKFTKVHLHQASDSYEAFKKKTNLKKSFKVYKNKQLLAKANGKNTQLKVDISDQRLLMLVNGKVALSSPCTTGAKRKLEPNTKIIRDKRTPKGIFKITEKISDKRSTIFGKFYRNGKLVYKGDRRKYRGSKAKYVGASLKNWMRLTSSGIGLHASKYIKRYPGTNGCIRLPFDVANIVFKKVKKGTKVSIVN